MAENISMVNGMYLLGAVVPEVSQKNGTFPGQVTSCRDRLTLPPDSLAPSLK